MSKWISRPLLLLLLFFASLKAPVFAVSPHPDAMELNERAVAIITNGSEDVEKLERALLHLREALSIEPDYQYALSNKLNVLLQLEQFELAYDTARRIAELSDGQLGQLYVCILEDAFGLALEDPFTCYAEVAVAMREGMGDEAENDLNYVFALKMAEADEFNAIAERFLNRQESDALREMNHHLLIESSRHDILADMVPSRPGMPPE